MRIEYHRTLLADRIRNEAFQRALAAVIVPGVTTLADIGAGSGLLAMLALKLGAKEVFLYEMAEVGVIAERILEHNRCRNWHLFPCHSTEMDEPPRVDVVVSETLGNYALEEDIVATMNDARARHLKPGGIVIPRAITQIVAPVVTQRIHDELTAWDRVGYGLDFAPARTMSLNNIYVRTLTPTDLLQGMAGAKQWDSVDLATKSRSNRKGEAGWRLDAPATIHGFAAWWTAELAPGITLSTAPDAPRTHWEQLYLPLLTPISGHAGDAITLALRSTTSRQGGTNLAWTVVRADKSGKTVERQALDLEKGYLP
jgi:protein arginine N-methyltransferase 1